MAVSFQGNEEGNGRMSSIKDAHMTPLPGSVSLDFSLQDVVTGTFSLGFGFPLGTQLCVATSSGPLALARPPLLI